MATLIWERLILRPVVFVLGVIAPAVVLVQVIAARSIFPHRLPVGNGRR